MADIKDHEVGRGGQAGAIRLFRDEGDGTFSVAVTANMREWDTGSLAWVKAVGPSGVLSVSGSSAVAGSGSTSVTQSTSPWVVGGNVGASLVGTSAVSVQGTVTVAAHAVTQGTSPWVVSMSGTVTAVPSGTQSVSQAGSFSVTQGTSPWLTSLSGTNLVSQAGSFSVVQGTSPWIIGGGAVSIAGTALVSLSGTNLVSLSGTNLVSLSGTNLVSVSGSVVQHQDVGRAQVTLFVDRAAGVTSEAAASLSGTKALLSLASSTSYVVSAGKTLRIQAANMAVRNTSTVVSSSRWRIRVGANSTTGPPLLELEAGTSGAVAEESATAQAVIPDGLEIAAGTSLSFSHVDSATTATTSLSVVGFEY